MFTSYTNGNQVITNVDEDWEFEGAGWETAMRWIDLKNIFQRPLDTSADFSKTFSSKYGSENFLKVVTRGRPDL